MRKKIVILATVMLAFCGSLSAQNQVHLAWLNDGEVITDAVAESDGTELKITPDTKGVAGSVVNKPISLVCTFTSDELKTIDPNSVSFEVKWYYYMSTRRSLMGTYVVNVNPEDADDDGFVKMICTKTNPRAGWWDVQIKNKNTGLLVEFGKKTIFSILMR